MAKFKDFVTALQNDLLSARASSDLESVAIAKMYSSNEYLKALDISVPRMKIKEVDVEIDGYTNLADAKSLEEQSSISNELLIDHSIDIASTKLSKLRGDKTKISDVLQKTKVDLVKYSNRYLNKDKTLLVRINKITANFEKSFEGKIIGISKENRKVLQTLYRTIGPELITFTSKILSKKKALDFTFRTDESENSSHPIKFRFTIVEDDLIWEVDKHL